jgi:hypothetical protein
LKSIPIAWLAAADYEKTHEIVFFHSPREASTAAHTLARHSEGEVPIVWHEDPPGFIVSVLANDVSVMHN